MTKPPIKGISQFAPDIRDVPCKPCGASGIEPRSWSDPALLAAFLRTDGELGNLEADALLAEIVRRGLDI